MRTITKALGVVACATLTLAGCSAGGNDEAAGDADTIRVAYQKFGTFTQLDALLQDVKTKFEASNDGVTVELVPIEAQQNDYFTKLALMNQSPTTAPDVMYEDTFMIKSDVDAGYLAPLDDYVATWDEWDRFYDNAKQAGLGDDGALYGIPMGTDTRALWYNKNLFTEAGLPVPWEPKTWQEVLDAAKTIKAKLPDVIPLNVYSGKPMGEGAVMQGFEMFLYGTGDTLYDTDSSKWITGSQGFTDSLQFIADLYQGGYGPTPQQALDVNVGTKVAAEWLPAGELAMSLDGSWLSSSWIEGGPAPWPEWDDVMAQAPMPTQNGEDPGAVSMSGGWTLAMGAGSDNPDAAWDFIATALNKENSKRYDIEATQIAVRDDVAEDAEYVATNSTFEFFSSLVPVTQYRPATGDYAQISNEIAVAMEAVMTGSQTPQEAAAVYDKAVIGIVGEENTQSG